MQVLTYDDFGSQVRVEVTPADGFAYIRIDNGASLLMPSPEEMERLAAALQAVAQMVRAGEL